jgi:uncharacterized membrane protein
MSTSEDELQALKAQVAQLTARIYRLEKVLVITGEPQPAAPAKPPVVAPPVQQPVPPLPPQSTISAKPPVKPPKEQINLEKKIGQYWLNRIGIIAILVGVSYFLKYAFENNWIGPGGRIAIGLLAGIGIILWSERFRSKGHKAFSYSLKAVGIGTLYLSLWGAYQLYHLMPSAAAFVAMIVVTASTITLALTQDAELLVAFAIIGGFSTPVLLSTGQNHEVVLFSYTALLDLAILVISVFKPWRRLLWGSFVGTCILYWGWWMKYYSDDQRTVTVLFAALFAAIFAAIPLFTSHERSTRFTGPSATLTLLPLLNAAVFFFNLFEMYRQHTVTLTWYALGLAAVYLGISNAFRRRFNDAEGKIILLLHVAIAIAFITIAIPLKMNGHWITMGWLIESAVLLWIAVKTQTDLLRYLAVAALVLGIFRVLFIDNFYPQTLILNWRFATYMVAVAVLGGIIYFGRRYAKEKERPFLRLASIALNILALVALTMEASGYFSRQGAASYRIGGYSGEYTNLRLAEDFSYSAVWLAYGAMLMIIGFKRRSAFVRWQALALITLTIGKVFIYDVSELERGYRILSFIALGAVLLGISFIYQRDWLKLSPQSAEKPSSEAVRLDVL